MDLTNVDEILKGEIVPAEPGVEPRYSILIWATGPASISAALQDDEGCYVVESGGWATVEAALDDLATEIRLRNKRIENNLARCAAHPEGGWVTGVGCLECYTKHA